MTEPEFYFAFEFSSDEPPAPFIEELTSGVLGHLGCSARDVPELSGVLTHALAAGPRGARRCDVRFAVHGRVLEILVASNGSPPWRTSFRFR